MGITTVSAETFDRLMLELSEPPKAIPALVAALAKPRRLILQISTGA